MLRNIVEKDPFLYCQPEKLFVEELKKPVHQVKPAYFNSRKAEKGEANVNGAFLASEFSDELLDTSYADFGSFLKVYEIGGDKYPIITRKGKTSVFEEYIITVTEKETVITAEDTEGIRRGLVFIEDEMRRREGAFLPIGEIKRTPHIKSRITHCFFAPINRPPNNGEELGDDIDYYPEEYLNRLVHDGSNGVWVYTKFSDLLPSGIIAEYGQDSERKIKKLNKTIEKCRRYGIKVFIMAIEPVGLRGELAIKYKDIGGAVATDGGRCFCTSSKRGAEYIYEAYKTLFEKCPDLGGVIALTTGEMITNCSSAYGDIKKGIFTCPNCRDKRAGEILADAVEAMKKGVRASKPDAEFISWTYGHRSWENEDVEDYARLIPGDSCMLQGFEDAGSSIQLGKERIANDYWLSYIGPSDMFKNTAAFAKKYGKTIYAKTQVCCSHEVASVPYIPVPGNLFDKYKAMHSLGVKGVMQCWYFGNYPSLMNKAAGELAFLSDFSDKKSFLLYLAGIYFGKAKAEKVVTAWEYFEKGYRNCILNIMTSYYGPFHDGPVWLLQLKPKNYPLPRSWQYGDMMNGDRINESLLSGHTLEEAITLAEEMSENWNKGMDYLEGLGETSEETEQESVAKALSLQFESGMNILKFYYLRDKLGNKEGNLKETLLKMENIVHREIEISESLAMVSEKDRRLGYHTEAEGFKYFPEKLYDRAEYLRKLIKTEFAEVFERIEKGLSPLEYYDGVEEGVPRYKIGSGWMSFSDSNAKMRIDEDAESLKIEVMAKKEEGITIAGEFNLFKFNPPIYIDEKGTPFIPVRVWMFFGMTERAREDELKKYKVEVLPSDEEFPGSHFLITLKKKDFDITDKPMKISIHTNVTEYRPASYLRYTEDRTAYLGKYDINPDNFIWLER
ncbi:MAG: hypothetical protein IJD97_07615 [Clostridia bacterium]|nr:hypothetical protein [Clostridia bacterium]